MMSTELFGPLEHAETLVSHITHEMIYDVCVNLPKAKMIIEALTSTPNSFVTVANSVIKARCGANRIQGCVVNLPRKITTLTTKDVDDIFTKNIGPDSIKTALVVIAYASKTKRLLNPSRMSEVEDEHFGALEQQLKQSLLLSKKDYILLKMGPETHKVNGIIQPKGHCKCDFVFTYDDAEVIFMSHKDYKGGYLANSFQQFSGITDQSLGEYSEHHEVKAFVKDVGEILAHKDWDGFKKAPQGLHFARRVQDVELCNAAIFGRDVKNGFGRNNVHTLLQGEIVLAKTRSWYELSCSGDSLLNPELRKDNFIPEHYQPNFVARRQRNRTQIFNEARFMIMADHRCTKYGIPELEKEMMNLGDYTK